MQRLRWAADLHFDHATGPAIDEFLALLRSADTSRLLIVGDLSNASRLTADLAAIADTGVEVDFVLGNHDHFGASIAAVRDAVIALGAERPALRWLPPTGVVALDAETVVIGVDGWADGRHGNALTTPLVLNDDRLIGEIAAQGTRAGRLAVKQALADADAARLATLLERACAAAERVVVVTHVPPFPEALPNTGRLSNPAWLPILVCGATGTALRQSARAHPRHQFVVLCGHAHVAADVLIASNLRCIVAGARYGQPQLQELVL